MIVCDVFLATMLLRRCHGSFCSTTSRISLGPPIVVFPSRAQHGGEQEEGGGGDEGGVQGRVGHADIRVHAVGDEVGGDQLQGVRWGHEVRGRRGSAGSAATMAAMPVAMAAATAASWLAMDLSRSLPRASTAPMASSRALRRAGCRRRSIVENSS